jgi:hypothetical protein
MGFNPFNPKEYFDAGKGLFETASGQSKVDIRDVPDAPTQLAPSETRSAAETAYLQSLGQQQAFGSHLAARATGGGGPSPAEIEANNRMRERLAYAQSLAASSRGANRLSAGRTAIREGYGATGALESDLQATRANEQLGAEQTYAGYLSSLGGQNQAQQQIGQTDQQALLDAEMQNRQLRVQRDVERANLGQRKAERGSTFAFGDGKQGSGGGAVGNIGKLFAGG